MLKKINQFPILKSNYSKDFISFAFGFFVTSFIALVTSIYINKSLNNQDLGEFTFYKSLLELLSYVFTLLLYRSYLRFNAVKVNDYVVRIVKVFSVFSLIVISFISYLYLKSVFAMFFAFFVIYEERLYFLRSILNTKKLNVLRIGAALITMTSILIISFLFNLRSDLVLFAYGIGFSISLFMFVGNYKREEREMIDREEVSFKRLLFFSLPALGATLLKVFQDFFSQFMIKEFYSFAELSTFSIALRVLLSVKLFSSLLMMYYPSIYFREIQNKNKKLIYKIRRYMSVFMLFVCTVAMLFAREFYLIMGAREYLSYVLFFQILVCAEFFNVVGGFYGVFLAHIVKTHVSMVIYFITTVINIVILFVFLESHGIIIAAIGALISNILLFLYHILVTRNMEEKYLQIT